MTARIILAALAATLAMFVWMSAAHMSPLGMVGIKTLPDDTAVSAALKATAGEQAGLYMFPTAGMGGKGAPGPTGVIVYSPKDAPSMDQITPKMVSEFIIEAIQILILAFIIASAKVDGFACRFGLAAGVGAMVGISTNGSYHIWYSYPLDYSIANAAIQVIGYAIAGLVLAKLLPKHNSATA